MFAGFQWLSQVWGQTKTTPNHYVLNSTGGIAFGGNASRAGVRECICNVVVAESTGGLAWGGTTVFDDIITTGGIAFGGAVSRVAIAGDVFDGYSAVWFLGEVGNGTPGEYHDETRNHLDGQGGGGVAANCPVPASSCQGGQTFAGKQFITIPRPGMVSTQPISASCWIRVTSFFRPKTFVSLGSDTLDGDAWYYQVGVNFLNQVFVSVNTLDGERHLTGATRLERDRLYHVAAVWSPGHGLTIYLNGIEDKTTSITEAELVEASNGGYLGRFNSGQMVEGDVADVRLRGDVPPSAWWHAEYTSRCQPDFVEVGTEETLS